MARASRRTRAASLAAARASRTPEQQLDLIATRPGESRREVARLLRQIVATPSTPPPNHNEAHTAAKNARRAAALAAHRS